MKIENSQGSYTIDDDEIVTDSEGDNGRCNDIAGQYVDDADEDSGRTGQDVERDFEAVLKYACAKSQEVESFTFGDWDAWCCEAPQPSA